jgi:hypothetical protein
LWKGDVTRELVALAATAARRSLLGQRDEGYEPSEASWVALGQAVRWLLRDTTADELEVAREPARLASVCRLTFSEPARAALCALEAARDAALGAPTVSAASYQAVRAAAAATAISKSAAASVKGRSSYEVNDIFDASKATAMDWYDTWITRVVRYRMRREGARLDD